VSEAKEARKQLRLKYETRAVHIAAEQVITIFHISNVFKVTRTHAYDLIPLVWYKN
jgi:hypothetical protein